MTAALWPVAMVTGHRPQHLANPDDIDWLAGELLRVAMKLRDQHQTRTLISGLALGTDMLWANAAIRLKLDLAAHIPFPQQPDVWRDPELVRQWRRMRDYADRTGGVTVYGDLAGTVGPERKRLVNALLHKRNAGMIEATMLGGGVTVAVLRTSKLDGGTRSAYDKALAAGAPIIRVDPDRRSSTMASAGNQKTFQQQQETLPI